MENILQCPRAVHSAPLPFMLQLLAGSSIILPRRRRMPFDQQNRTFRLLLSRNLLSVASGFLLSTFVSLFAYPTCLAQLMAVQIEVGFVDSA